MKKGRRGLGRKEKRKKKKQGCVCGCALLVCAQGMTCIIPWRLCCHLHALNDPFFLITL
jgi:hypothetical protein